MKLSKTVIAIAALLGAAATAQAATVTFSNIKGTWYDGNPATNISYSGNNSTFASADWGTGGTSGYDFAAAAGAPSVVVPPSPSPDFQLGTFTHRNQPINAGSSITDVKLKVTADVDVDGTGVGPKEFTFQFLHNETDNGANPCANGQANNQGVNINGCADQVTFQSLTSSDTFIIGGMTYTIAIVGFEVSGSVIPEFWTTEQANNSANLFAQVRVSTAVPEPGMLALVGIGLLGAAAARRRKA